MKSALMIAGALLVSACVSTMPSPEALIAKPASSAEVMAQTNYDNAYRITLSRMTLCYAGNAIRVWGDKAKDNALISLATVIPDGVAGTIKLEPKNEGTRVTIYSAGTLPTDSMKKKIDYWLNRGGEECNATDQ